MSNSDGGFLFRETLKSYDGSRWTVVEGSGPTAQDAVQNLYDGFLEMFPDEIGPLLQKKRDINYVQVTETAQYAFAERVSRAKEYFAKSTVKEKLGGQEVDEDDDRPRRRRQVEDDDEPAPRRSSRRDDDDEDDRPQRRSRSYGDDADTPSNAPRCDHGKMKRLEGTNKEGKDYAGWVCSGDVPRDEQCPAKWDKKQGGGGYGRRRY